MVMVPLARRSIHPRPSEPPVTPMSALTSPPCVPVLSTRMLVPDQISTQPVDVTGLPGRVTGLRRNWAVTAFEQLLAGLFGAMWPDPADSTSPSTTTVHPSR